MKKGSILLAALVALMALGFTSMNAAYAEGTVEGAVIDQEGEAVAGAHVMIVAAVRERGEHPFHARTESGEDGSFGFADVPAGEYFVVAGMRDAGRDRERIEVQDNQVTNVELQLQVREREEIETGSVSGVVIDADGEPVEGARVVIPLRANRHMRRHIRLNTQTDANGVFAFENVPVGNHRIVAFARRVGGAREMIEVAADQNTEVELQLMGRQDRGGDDDDNGGRRGRGGRGGGGGR